MSGLGLTYSDALGGFDLALEPAGDRLARDGGVVTAVLVSLWSDARLDDDSLATFAVDHRRGWWADTEEDRHGSLLWVLQREKATPETVARAEEFARSALQWLIDDEIADSVDVAGEITDTHTLCLSITVHRSSAGRWSHLWQGTQEYLGDVGGVLLRVAA